MGPSAANLRDRVERICRQPRPERELRAQVLEQVRAVVPFAYHAWLLTDPETWVGTAPLAETPDLAALPELVRLKYQASTNRWTGLTADRAVAWPQPSHEGVLRPSTWRRLLESYGVSDVASLSLRDRYGSWSFLDLWRCGGSAPRFTPAELRLLSELAAPLTQGLRRALAATFVLRINPTTDQGPAVLVLDDDLRPQLNTTGADDQLRALLPTAPGLSPIPAVAYNVAAQLLARESGVDDRPARARTHLADGRWISVAATRLTGVAGSRAGGIAVTLQAMAPYERVDIYARTHGLSERERQLVHELAGGVDTARLARALHISELTVQDHLKSIFTKTGTNNRYELITLASGSDR